ncbi:MAG: pantoate--beta-alanine ligase [Chloroflexota bacterium]
MKVVQTIAEMKALRRTLKEPVGFVPTMGYLHEGHLTLVRRAKENNASVIVSIFVNPTQFGPTDDLEKYPRDTEADLAKLQKLETDVVFMPTPEVMYPEGFNTWITVEKVTKRLEGTIRPGHFKGVATVVAKLFNIVAPDKAYFGQKDAQQVVVVKKMVADLNMNLEIVVVPTVREPDGLAMSSRNIYLSPEDRKKAVILHDSLMFAQKLVSQGEKNAERIRQEMVALIKKVVPESAIDYVSIADNTTLDELNEIRPPALISLVVRFGRTRLLDNIVV